MYLCGWDKCLLDHPSYLLVWGHSWLCYLEWGEKGPFVHVELFRLVLDCLYLNFLTFYFDFFFCLLELRSGRVSFTCHTKAPWNITLHLTIISLTFKDLCQIFYLPTRIILERGTVLCFKLSLLSLSLEALCNSLWLPYLFLLSHQPCLLCFAGDRLQVQLLSFSPSYLYHSLCFPFLEALHWHPNSSRFSFMSFQEVHF